MLGQVGSRWMDRLHQQLSKELKVNGWSQMEIAKALGTTQSTVSRQIMKPVTELGATADETTIDGWARELAQSLNQFGTAANIVRQRLIFEFQFGSNQTLRYDKTLTGLNLDSDQSSRALLRRLDSGRRYAFAVLVVIVASDGLRFVRTLFEQSINPLNGLLQSSYCVTLGSRSKRYGEEGLSQKIIAPTFSFECKGVFKF